MLKERIIEIILRDLYDDDEDYRTDATDCADAIMQTREMAAIRTALDNTMDVIENTYAHDADGERDESADPDCSAADIVEQLCDIEHNVDEAYGYVFGPNDESDETMTCALCGKVEAEHDAITRGWIPDYLDGEEHKVDPVCVECCAARITTNDDGDSILIMTAH